MPNIIKIPTNPKLLQSLLSPLTYNNQFFRETLNKNFITTDNGTHQELTFSEDFSQELQRGYQIGETILSNLPQTRDPKFIFELFADLGITDEDLIKFSLQITSQSSGALPTILTEPISVLGRQLFQIIGETGTWKYIRGKHDSLVSIDHCVLGKPLRYMLGSLVFEIANADFIQKFKIVGELSNPASYQIIPTENYLSLDLDDLLKLEDESDISKEDKQKHLVSLLLVAGDDDRIEIDIDSAHPESVLLFLKLILNEVNTGKIKPTNAITALVTEIISKHNILASDLNKFVESVLNFYTHHDDIPNRDTKQLIKALAYPLESSTEYQTTFSYMEAVLNKDGEFLVSHRLKHLPTADTLQNDIRRYKIAVSSVGSSTSPELVQYIDINDLRNTLLDHYVPSSTIDFLLPQLNQDGLLKLFSELEPKIVPSASGELELEKYDRPTAYVKILVNTDHTVSLQLIMHRKEKETATQLYDISTTIDVSNDTPPKLTFRDHVCKQYAPDKFHLYETFRQKTLIDVLPKLIRKQALNEKEAQLVTQTTLPYTILRNNRIELGKVTDKKIAMLLTLQNPEQLDHLSDENFPIFYEACFTIISQSQNVNYPLLLKFINDNQQKYLDQLQAKTAIKHKSSFSNMAKNVNQALKVINAKHEAPLTQAEIDTLFERFYNAPDKLTDDDNKALNKLVVSFLQLEDGKLNYRGWPHVLFSENPKARILAMHQIATFANLGEIKAQNYLLTVFNRKAPGTKNQNVLSDLIDPNNLITAMATSRFVTLKQCYALNPINNQTEWDKKVTRAALRPENEILIPQLKPILKEEAAISIGKPGNIVQTIIDWTVTAISFAYETDRYKELVEGQRARVLLQTATPMTDSTANNDANKKLQDLGQQLNVGNGRTKHLRRDSAEESARELEEIKRIAEKTDPDAQFKANRMKYKNVHASTPTSYDSAKSPSSVPS